MPGRPGQLDGDRQPHASGMCGQGPPCMASSSTAPVQIQRCSLRSQGRGGSENPTRLDQPATVVPTEGSSAMITTGADPVPSTGYRPSKAGGRFSAKARRPSLFTEHPAEAGDAFQSGTPGDGATRVRWLTVRTDSAASLPQLPGRRRRPLSGSPSRSSVRFLGEIVSGPVVAVLYRGR